MVLNVLGITDKEIEELDIDILTKVVEKGYEDIQKRVNTAKDDHRYPQGMLLVLGELKYILSKTPA